MQTKIDTSKYGRTFGHNPRPAQYSWWHFSAEPTCAETFYAFTGTYATAKRLAKLQAVKQGVAILYVGA